MYPSFRASALVLAGGLLALASCKKDDTTTPTPTSTAQSQTTTNLATTSTPSATGAPIPPRHYTFFSLANNKEVPYADSNSTKWDIAVRATTILVNAGVSGPGQGGAQVYSGLYSDVTTAPTTGYAVDAATTKAIPTGSGNGWYTYNSTTNVITPTPGRILLIRTATGQYAKLEIQSYYKDAPASPTSASASGYYTFRYVYQPNGTSLQ